jgi:hypothetical protein
MVDTEGAAHYCCLMIGRVNWAITLGRHDVQHVVSALSCQHWSNDERRNVATIPAAAPPAPTPGYAQEQTSMPHDPPATPPSHTDIPSALCYLEPHLRQQEITKKKKKKKSDDEDQDEGHHAAKMKTKMKIPARKLLWNCSVNCGMKTPTRYRNGIQ